MVYCTECKKVLNKKEQSDWKAETETLEIPPYCKEHRSLVLAKMVVATTLKGNM